MIFRGPFFHIDVSLDVVTDTTVFHLIVITETLVVTWNIDLIEEVHVVFELTLTHSPSLQPFLTMLNIHQFDFRNSNVAHLKFLLEIHFQLPCHLLLKYLCIQYLSLNFSPFIAFARVCSTNGRLVDSFHLQTV